MFTVLKSNKHIHPTLDLKSLNKFLYIPKVLMQSARSVIASLRQGEHLASVDTQNAYLHVPIYSPHQCFLHLAVADYHYQFVPLPLSLSSVPRLFTKILAPLLSLFRTQGIQVRGYLHNLLLKHAPPSYLSVNVRKTQSA